MKKRPLPPLAMAFSHRLLGCCECDELASNFLYDKTTVTELKNKLKGNEKLRETRQLQIVPSMWFPFSSLFYCPPLPSPTPMIGVSGVSALLRPAAPASGLGGRHACWSQGYLCQPDAQHLMSWLSLVMLGLSVQVRKQSKQCYHNDNVSIHVLILDFIEGLI